MPEVYVLVEKKQSMGFKVARIVVLILAIASLIINFAIPLFLIVPDLGGYAVLKLPGI